ncbi:tRNA (uracil-5-)-methyltransferase Gid [Williamsoniiplasma somnilux]|uniref:Methylenetetrahydrofolate--tRNA-(uracil-5-)-methyltransferase TrmFO n=1 Tax=Williamsoniiplasma somnilux TaxID=215578 RepID=A0A2K8NXR0_9MOLU|nr:methylenetetrahydrofolate--tRNA-(uracil(54)-C(5))-methyltransferase (FADH(2)-oxidizing) TrmFO [Williamsoniiplasma somnilux]ATZ18622.1 tRNA (uracil-5-)-methyltransferase Gid [Williamsoniiplasma somnilux]
MKDIKIIGAGLAGCESAYQLTKKGYKVKLYEIKEIKRNDVQKTNLFAELVCSNTLRSKSFKNAVGILKEEMKQFGSLILKAAEFAKIPGDDALAVDREIFSNFITQAIKTNSNIEVVSQEVDKIDDENDITLIASGPLTTDNLQIEIQRLIGNQKMYFLDASSPIIEKDSIDMTKVYKNSRHKTGDGEYICVPLNEQEFESFAQKLRNAQTIELKNFEKEIYFKGCQPIEAIAKLGNKILLRGPLSPNNLETPDNKKPFAVVQLRQDDVKDSLYNFVGFQTNMKWPEQKIILSSLPGMQNIKISRYGVMHKNNYINSPKILNHKLQVMRKKNVFFAGQITGVEGYVESTAIGIMAALGIIATIENKKLPKMPNTIVMGSLVNYITNSKIKKFNPMKANLGLVDKLTPGVENYDYYSKSKEDLLRYFKDIQNILN